jgi:predicted Zn-dependent protease
MVPCGKPTVRDSVVLLYLHYSCRSITSLLFHIATLESRSGNVTNARLLFAAGITKCPNHVPLYQAWASLEVRDGDIITAKRLIGEALTRNKRNGSGWLVAAKIEEKMGNHGLVGLILRRGLECAPMDTELYSELANYEMNAGRIDSVSLPLRHH